MQINLNSGESLTAVQAAGVTTTAPTAKVDYNDGSGPRTAMGSLSGVTAVTLLTGPTNGVRSVRGLSILNGDTVAQTVTINHVQGGTSYPVATVTLAAGDTLILGEQCGVMNSSGGFKSNSTALSTVLPDDTELLVGTGEDAGLLWSTGDASNHAVVLFVGDTSQQLHITDKGARATDWNISAGTHPAVYIHSNTTPATDYIVIGNHDGTTAYFNVAGGTTLEHQIAGTTVQLMTAGGVQDRGVAAVTATVGGGTTGLIPAGAKNVTVTSDNADKQISLPAASVGDEIRILVGSTGCELISAVAAHKVNDVVVGATNEAALTATNLYVCRYVAENTWVVVGYTKLGAVQSALVPDAL